MIDVKKQTAIFARERADIPEDATRALFDLGFIEEHVCKKILLRNEYMSKLSHKNKTMLKITLAEKYCLSFSTVEKYLHDFT